MKINCKKNGPIIIAGKIELFNDEQEVKTDKEVIALCACGQSGNKPFCDGSHSKQNHNNDNK